MDLTVTTFNTAMTETACEILGKHRQKKIACETSKEDSLSKTILLGTLEACRHSGRKRKCWLANIKEVTSLLMPELLKTASCRKKKKL